jgi:hypothetical protein
VRLGGAATYNTFDELLFAPTALSRVIALPASFDELAGALLKERITNSYMASLLTGAPVSDIPGRVLLYGSTIFSSSANVSFSYDKTARTSVTGTIGAARTQHMRSDRDNQSSVQPLLNNSTAGYAGVSVSHARSPRTQVGAGISVGRNISSIQDNYQGSITAFIGRRMGLHWLAQAHGGAGVITARRQLYILPTGPQYQAGGSLAYSANGHTFLAAVERMFGDSYGIAARSTINASGAWLWKPHGSRWQMDANYSRQWFAASALGNLDTWQTAARLTRAVTAHLSSSVECAYGSYSGRFEYTGRLAQKAVRAVLVWTPGPARTR